ncbi:MAG: 4-hydroxybenzoyl-CoA reductase [Planctomycetes bacterium]|nr:4-hydroxybenzoyl-CoA reductase [Planctomycetota bacterium]
MLRLPEFTLHQARSLQEACALVAEAPQSTRLLAGGTDLLPNMKRRHQHAQRLVALRNVSELRGVAGHGSGEMRVGAMSTLSQLARNQELQKSWPGFVRALRSISSPVLRTTGTIGGNLCLDTRCNYYNQSEEWRQAIGGCMKEVGDTCWVAPSSSHCWAISASDSAPLLCAIGARVRLASVRGERVIPLEQLFVDDGIAYLGKAADEVLVDILLPPVANTRATYWKLRRRGSIDFPVLGVGAALRLDAHGVVEHVRIYLGAVASAPLRAEKAEEALLGQPLTEASVRAAGEAARGVANALDNTDFTMLWRRQMTAVWVEGALRELGGLAPRAHMPEMPLGAPGMVV